MRIPNRILGFALVSMWALGMVSFERVGAEPLLLTNSPPHVAITFPTNILPDGRSGIVIAPSYVRLEAEASDPDGSIQCVQFFEGTNLLGVSTKAPYSVAWLVGKLPPGQPPDQPLRYSVSAIAFDDLGASTRSESVPVRVYPMWQLSPLVELVSPKDGDIFAAPATFDFTVRLLLSNHLLDAPPPLPVTFYIGTNVVRASTNQPYSITVTNLPEGEYKLRAAHFELFSDDPPLITIRVAKLGIKPATRTGAGSLKFGAFNQQDHATTVVQSSADLRQWALFLTNDSSAQSFYFLTNPTNQERRFYRLLSQPSH